jgi:hypothetical protein
MMGKRLTVSADEQGGADQVVGRFLQDLERQETSPQTRRANQLDLLHVAGRFG